MSTDNIEHKLETKKTPANLKAELDQLAKEPVTPPGNQVIHSKRTWKDRLHDLLRSKKFWLLTILLLLLALTAIWLIQPSRLWLLNTIGMRATITITVQSPGEGDKPASQLGKAQVLVGEREFATDQQGKVVITDQPYGPAHITVEKRGFETTSQDLQLDVDPFFNLLTSQPNFSAPNLQFSLKAVGIAVMFTAIDWLSGQPITEGDFTAGDITTKPSPDGLVTFKTVTEADTLDVVANFGGRYLDRAFTIPVVSEQPPSEVFVPGGRHYFLSNRDGSLGVYGSNVDGSDTSVVIAGTGQEQPDTTLAISPSGKFGVLSSTRDAVRDGQKNLIPQLYVIDLEKKLLIKVDDGRGFYFIDWAGENLVYQKVLELGSSGQQRLALKVVDVSSRQVSELATASFFDETFIAFEQVISRHGSDQNTDGQVSLPQESFVRRYDLKNKSVRDLGQAVVSMQQLDADRIVLGLADGKWREYNPNTGVLKDAPPAGVSERTFLGSLSPDGQQRLVVDRIDGRFTLITKAAADGAEKQLYANASLTGPVRWLQNDVVIFRLQSSSETADYAISTRGGEAKKVSNVTATFTQGPGRFRQY